MNNLAEWINGKQNMGFYTKKETSHFEDVTDLDIPKPCMSSEHNPPTMLYISPGKKYIHVCPACGNRSVIYGSTVRY